MGQNINIVNEGGSTPYSVVDQDGKTLSSHQREDKAIESAISFGGTHWVVKQGRLRVTVETEKQEGPEEPKLTTIKVVDNTGDPDNLNLGYQLFEAPIGEIITGGLLTITNTGDVSLVISDISVDNDSFSFESSSIGDPIALGESLEVNVSFVPVVVGDINGKLTINGNILEPVVVDLFGRGLEQIDDTVEPDQAINLPWGLSADPADHRPIDAPNRVIEDQIFDGKNEFFGGNIKLVNCTFNFGVGTHRIRGDGEGWAWFVGCTWIGEYDQEGGHITDTPLYKWRGAYFEDCEISDVKWPTEISNHTGMKTKLVYNTTITNAEDPLKNLETGFLVRDVTVRGDAAIDGWHPDVLQNWGPNGSTLSGVIVGLDVEGRMGGIRGQTVKDLAIVNYRFRSTHSEWPAFDAADGENLLLKNVDTAGHHIATNDIRNVVRK